MGRYDGSWIRHGDGILMARTIILPFLPVVLGDNQCKFAVLNRSSPMRRNEAALLTLARYLWLSLTSRIWPLSIDTGESYSLYWNGLLELG